jgi:hypothetical protein
MTDTTSSTATGETTARAPRGRKKGPPRRPAARKRTTTQKKRSSSRRAGLSTLLSRWSSQATKAGKRIASQATEGATKARGASQRAIRASIREWKKLDAPRKVEFVAALLSALAAASGAVATARKKK